VRGRGRSPAFSAARPSSVSTNRNRSGGTPRVFGVVAWRGHHRHDAPCSRLVLRSPPSTRPMRPRCLGPTTIAAASGSIATSRRGAPPIIPGRMWVDTATSSGDVATNGSSASSACGRIAASPSEATNGSDAHRGGGQQGEPGDCEPSEPMNQGERSAVVIAEGDLGDHRAGGSLLLGAEVVCLPGRGSRSRRAAEQCHHVKSLPRRRPVAS
jgi:hypothetical protein